MSVTVTAAGKTSGSGSSGGVTIGAAISGGTDTRVLFNDGGVVADNSAFTFTKATGLLKTTALALGGATIGANAAAITGSLGIAGSIIQSTGGVSIAGDKADIGYNSSTAMRVASNWLIGWTGSTSGSGTITSNISQVSAGVLQVGTTTANALGQLNASVFVAGAGFYNAAVTTGVDVSGTGLRLFYQSNSLTWLGGAGVILSSPTAATLQFGSIDVASGAVAQTLRVQSNTGASTTGPDWTFIGAQGTTLGGSILFQTFNGSSNATRLTIAGNGVLTTSTHLNVGGSVATGTYLAFGTIGTNRGLMSAPADGVFTFQPTAGTNGFQLTANATSGLAQLGTATGSANALGQLNLATLLATGAVTAWSGTAIPAGGTAGSGLKLSSTANFGVFFGSGAPTLSAAKGSIYLRSDGSGTGDRAYINTDGGTTWTALTTAA